METLSRVSSHHNERLMAHVDHLPALADQVGQGDWSELAVRVRAEHDFFHSTLIPHMEAVETGLHRELDRLLSCRIAMEPMEREHEAIRSLVGQLGRFGGKAELSQGEAIELNRVLMKLYSMLKVHLREESLYVPILEHNLDRPQIEALIASLQHRTRVDL